MKIVLIVIVSSLLFGCSRGSSQTNAAKSDAMTLTVSTGKVFKAPSDAQIRASIESIQVDPMKQDGYAILDRDEMTYMQVGSITTKTFVVEYQEASLERHFVSDRKDFSIDEVVQALIEYRDGKINWAKYGSWSKLDP